MSISAPPTSPTPSSCPPSTYDNLFVIRGDRIHIISTSDTSNEVAVWSIDGHVKRSPTSPSPCKLVRRLRGIPFPKDVKMVTQTRALILCNRELRLYDLSTGILVT